MAERVRENGADVADLRGLREAVDLLDTLPFTVTLWAVQNVAYDLLQTTYPEMLNQAESGDEEAAA